MYDSADLDTAFFDILEEVTKQIVLTHQCGISDQKDSAVNECNINSHV